jgi:peptidyl-tRNA hydrolase
LFDKPNACYFNVKKSEIGVSCQMETKQVIVVNEALRLPRGKLAAQVAHAAVGAFVEAREEAKQAWLISGMAKIVLKVDGEADLTRLYELAIHRKIPARLIRDAGKTVVVEGTLTCLGLGPAGDSDLDELTGQLKLLR